MLENETSETKIQKQFENETELTQLHFKNFDFKFTTILKMKFNNLEPYGKWNINY